MRRGTIKREAVRHAAFGLRVHSVTELPRFSLLRGSDAFAEQLVDDVEDPVTEFGEARQLRRLALAGHSLQLVEHEIDALQALEEWRTRRQCENTQGGSGAGVAHRLLEPRDLAAHEQVEGDLRHEERLPRAVCVANGRANVVVGKAVKRVHRLEASPKDLSEDVADACATVKLVHFDTVSE